MIITSTSRASADCEDIVLRETETTRLVFRPKLVDNPNDDDAAVRGCFVYQRKRMAEDWEDHKDLDLTQLKADEWIKLELRSAELLHLHQELQALYELHRSEGIPWGEVEYVPARKNLMELVALDAGSLASALEDNELFGAQLLTRLLSWIVKGQDLDQIISAMETLGLDAIQDLSSLAALSNLKQVLRIWGEHHENSDEEFWQETFRSQALILAQIFAYPVVILEGKAYVGGKTIANAGGNVVDFLLANQLTRNVILVEIKTPVTRLLGAKYRGVYNASSEIVGATQQVSNYKNSLCNEFLALAKDSGADFEVFDPICLVIAGNVEAELSDAVKRKSFELFRGQLRSIQVLAYDEVFSKVRSLFGLINNQGHGLEEDQDLSAGGQDLETEEDEDPFSI